MTGRRPGDRTTKGSVPVLSAEEESGLDHGREDEDPLGPRREMTGFGDAVVELRERRIDVAIYLRARCGQGVAGVHRRRRHEGKRQQAGYESSLHHRSPSSYFTNGMPRA